MKLYTMMTLVLVISGTGTMAQSGDPLPLNGDKSQAEDYLSVTDPSKIEDAIEAYLNRNGIKASKVVGNNGTLHFVQVGFVGPNNLPNVVYMITALPPSGGETQAQLIGFNVETNVKTSNVSDSLYNVLAEANKLGFCSWFVDRGSIKCRSWIAIPSPQHPIPAEVIKQKIGMINSEWLKFSQDVLAASK